MSQENTGCTGPGGKQGGTGEYRVSQETTGCTGG